MLPGSLLQHVWTLQIKMQPLPTSLSLFPWQQGYFFPYLVSFFLPILGLRLIVLEKTRESLSDERAILLMEGWLPNPVEFCVEDIQQRQVIPGSQNWWLSPGVGEEKDSWRNSDLQRMRRAVSSVSAKALRCYWAAKELFWKPCAGMGRDRVLRNIGQFS